MKTIYNIFFLLLAVGVLTTACNTDDMSENEGEPAVISLMMNDIQTRGGDLFSGESLITKIRIYVINGSHVEKMQVFNSGETEFLNPFRIQTTTGAKTIYVVANEPTDMTAALESATTLNALTAIVTSPVSGSVVQPFTMTGSRAVNIVHVPAPGAPTQVTVDLKRLVAKLSLKIEKDTETEANNIPVILNGVWLYRAAAKSALLEGQTVTGQTYWNNYVGLGSVALTTTGTDIWGGTSAPLYIYENTGSVTDTLGRATYIVMEALYNNTSVRYKAYINDEHSAAADHKYSVKRNHHYQLTAIIKNPGEFDGLEIIYRVVPWEVTEKAVFMGHEYNVVIDEEGNVTIKNTEGVCAPHKVELKTVSPFTFNDNTTSKTFNSLVSGHSENYTLTPVPAAGAGNYLEVWYNDVKVKTFTK